MRRTIAFLLVLAECFSLAAAGAPAAYAQGDGQPYEIIEQTDAAAGVTPLEAALMGAQSTGEFADEAAKAADEAVQAAMDAQQAESADDALQYAQTAKQAAERAQAFAVRAKDEADWTAGAASIALEEAGNAYTFARDGYNPYLSANVSLTKEIGDHVSLSFFANNFTNARPYRKSWATGVSALFTPAFYYGLTCRIKL